MNVALAVGDESEDSEWISLGFILEDVPQGLLLD